MTKSLRFKMIAVITIVQLASNCLASSYDPTKPLELEKGFLKSRLKQDGNRIEAIGFEDKIASQPDDKDIKKNWSTGSNFKDFGYALLLGSPFALLMGATSYNTDRSQGEGFLILGSVLAGGGVGLLLAGNSYMSDAVDLHNQRLSNPPQERLPVRKGPQVTWRMTF